MDATNITSPASESAVKALANTLFAAWESHDARVFAQPFATDADFANVFGMHAKGRGAVERFHEPIFRTMFKDSRLTQTDVRVRFLRDDVAALDIGWEMTERATRWATSGRFVGA